MQLRETSLVPSRLAEDGRWDFVVPSVFSEDVTMCTVADYGCELRKRITNADYGCGFRIQTTNADYGCELWMRIMDADCGCGLPSLVPSRLAEDG